MPERDKQITKLRHHCNQTNRMLPNFDYTATYNYMCGGSWTCQTTVDGIAFEATAETKRLARELVSEQVLEYCLHQVHCTCFQISNQSKE